ncbi:dynamin family protein [Litchfieldia salsa]|uniref:Dynamin family protein n=1 Tax=Litchfieldia salsa TaxID=930152 RepID=A0A1H0W664_9BACI|nr:dynamin family protein [Litchfieldia salsa]SDP85796.1 Dynamin family protein [Litchfieldia salsa]
MSNYINLNEFETKKQNVLTYINEVIDIAEKLNAREITHYLNETLQQVQKDAFTLTVVGEFSRGKSTFINALLGKDVLPSKVKPTTAMINKIYYQEQPSFSLLFRDQTKEKKVLDHKAFRKLAAPREADEDDSEDQARYEQELNVFKEIAMAEVGFPNHFCEAGVEIYDTPGTNDIDVAREEITFTFVPKSDAVIFLLSATTPFAGTEMDFLKERILSEHINKVFFVINYKDRLQTEEDQMKVLNYVREKLQPLLPDPRLYLVSSLDALTIRRLEHNEEFRIKSQTYTNLHDTGFVQLESDLAHFFQYEKGQVKLEKPIRRMIKKTNELRTETIALRISATNMEIEEINQKIAELAPQVTRFKQNARLIIERLIVDLKSEETTITRKVETLLKDMSTNLSSSLDSYSGSLEDAEVKRFLKNIIRSYQSDIQKELNQLKGDILENHVTNAYKLLNSEEAQLNKAIKETFNLELEMNYNFDLSLYQNNDDLTGMILGAAGLGLSAIILAPALLVIGGIGAAISAFFFGDSIFNSFTDYRRNGRKEEIKKQVQQTLYDNRPTIVSQFRADWNKLAQSIEMTFEIEVHEKTLRLQEDLHQIRLEKETEKRSVEEQRHYFESLSERLIFIQEQSLKIIK